MPVKTVETAESAFSRVGARFGCEFRLVALCAGFTFKLELVLAIKTKIFSDFVRVQETVSVLSAPLDPGRIPSSLVHSGFIFIPVFWTAAFAYVSSLFQRAANEKEKMYGRPGLYDRGYEPAGYPPSGVSFAMPVPASLGDRGPCVLDDAKTGLWVLYARTEFQLVEQRSAAERQLIEAKHTAAMQQLEKTLHGA